MSHYTDYVLIIKVYETLACGCNNNTIFQKRAILTFPAVDVYRARQSGRAEALVMLPKSQDGDTDEFTIFRV